MKPPTNLRRPMFGLAMGIAGLGFTLTAIADDISGQNSLLCYGWHAAVCTQDEQCETMEPRKLNLPDFIKLDLAAKVATTTNSALERRETPIQNMSRSDGIIMLQGLQGNWAFSWIIIEATGAGTMTIGSATEGATIFTSCTLD